MKTAIPITTRLAITDCAARIFSHLHTENNGLRDLTQSRSRIIQRRDSVEVLRFIWKHGDHMDRAGVAARIAVWRHRHQNYIAILHHRIRDRERVRLSK